MNTETIRVFRQSGLPPRIVDYVAYQEEFGLTSDKILERAALNMEKAQRMFRYMERQLLKKHGAELRIDVPQSLQTISALITEFGTPVTFAQVNNSDEIVIMLMDEL